MNFIQIAGHLGADPETRFTPSGQKVTTFRVATNIRKNNKDETVWYRVTVWGDRFDKMIAYLKKGSAVIAVGELKPEIYIDKEGRPQLSLEVTAEFIRFSPFGRTDRAEGQQQQAPAHQAPQANPYASSGSSPGNYGGGGGMQPDFGSYGGIPTGGPSAGGFGAEPEYDDNKIPF